MAEASMAESVFSVLPYDVVLNIFFKLQDDPRYWARLACVCTKFSSIVRNVCWKTQCYATIPSVVSDLLPSPSAASASSSSPPPEAPPGGWASLHKLAVCCPGLLHAGVLLENSDFGLERELGPDESLRRSDREIIQSGPTRVSGENLEAGPSMTWSLYDDLVVDDTLYATSDCSVADDNGKQQDDGGGGTVASEIRLGKHLSLRKRRKICRSIGSHLASGVWNLSREQGNKLLASRFRGDCLYICDWPGCIHIEEKRNYMLFRGVFKDFKRSRVWRTINDGNRRKIGLKCAFCSCDETWDLHSAFCLRRVFGFHDDGEPVVRAYVCENGHVSGAWTALPLYA